MFLSRLLVFTVITQSLLLWLNYGSEPSYVILKGNLKWLFHVMFISTFLRFKRFDDRYVVNIIIEIDTI